VKGRFQPPLWIVPLAIAGLVALFGWWGDHRLRRTITQQLEAKLVSTLHANVTALEIWTTNQTRLATALAGEPDLRAHAKNIFEQASRPRTAGPPIDDLDAEQLSRYLRPRLNQLGYEVAQLVSTNFTIVTSSTSARGRLNPPPKVSEAHTNKFAELFASGGPVMITPFKPEMLMRRPPPGFAAQRRTNFVFRASRFASRSGGRGRRGDAALMQVAAPVIENGNVLGALALIINPDNEFTRILSVARSGESGETYAFDQTGLLISRSRFDDQLKELGLLDATNASSALNLRLRDPGVDLTQGRGSQNIGYTNESLTRFVSYALAGDDGLELESSRDYRGVPVVGAWRWLPQLGIGVITQIDAAEAFQPLRVLRGIFAALSTLLVMFAAGMFVFSYANIRSLRRLTEAELKLKQLGQYRLEEKIGEGGMGVVYRARHALMRRDTAVKLLLPDRADAAAIARFEREVCLTCQLTHPNTIQVYDYGHTPDGIFYYAMEYLRGLNLHQLVARFGPQPEARVVHILTQICESLAEAHALGLVHRDIKPSNIFLCERGGLPDSVKVLDFGLVRQFNRAGSEPHEEKEFVGTPSFMPPEAIKNSATSEPRSDLYAVGALGYYVLTGKFVFEAERVSQLHAMQLNTTPIPPRQQTDNAISAALEQVILRCLDRDPAQRPQTALALRDLLLATPHSADHTPAVRMTWWNTYRGQIEKPTTKDTATASSAPTVKIDFETRMK
jgi:eukaryotic-like serine/threonine-protein kinase